MEHEKGAAKGGDKQSHANGFWDGKGAITKQVLDSIPREIVGDQLDDQAHTVVLFGVSVFDLVRQ